MPLLADVDPLVLIALIAGAAVVIVVAASLIAVTRVLRQLSARLETIVGAMGEAPRETAPDEDLVERLRHDLEVGQALLESERERRSEPE